MKYESNNIAFSAKNDSNLITEDDQHLLHRLHAFSKNTPNKIAFKFIKSDSVSTEISYSDLYRQSASVSTFLFQHSLSTKTVLLIYDSEEEFAIGFFGCLLSGTIAIPLPPTDDIRLKHALPRILSIIKDSNADAILTDSKTKLALEQSVDLKNLSDVLIIDTSEKKQNPTTVTIQKNISLEDVAYLQYTSGSTSSPKGVIITHRNIVANCSAMKECWEIDSDAISVSWLPYYHDYGLVFGFLQTLFSGHTTIILSPLYFIRRPIRWLTAISDHKATHSGGPNFGFQACIDKFEPEKYSNLDLSSWICAHNGAEPIPKETLLDFYSTFKKYGLSWDSIYPTYGMAETTLVISTKKTGDPPNIKSVARGAYEKGIIASPEPEDESQSTVIGCGPSIGTFNVIIVDPKTGSRVPENTIGEIWVQDPSVAKGYWNNSKDTEKTFHAYTSDTQEGPFLRTGDLGFIDDHGEIYITSRLKDLIIVHGKNIYPSDIEFTVGKTHPAIKSHEVAAFSTTNAFEEKIVVVAEIKKKLMNNIKPQEIIEAIQEDISLEFELNVADIVLVKSGSIPKTSSGKIQRSTCKDHYLNNKLPALHTLKSRSNTDKQKLKFDSHWNKGLARAWVEVLNISLFDITLESNFFHLGGDSLKAIQLSDKLSNISQIEIKPSFILKNRTFLSQLNYMESISDSPYEINANDLVFTIENYPSDQESNTPLFTPFALTDIQQSYLLGRSSTFELGNVGCHYYSEFDSNGKDIDLLESSWNQVVQKHPMLGCILTANGQQQFQEKIHHYKFEEYDFSLLSHNEALKQAKDLRQTLSHRVLNPCNWPLFHISIVKLPKSTRICFGIDLLIADAHSLFILFKDWKFFYDNPQIHHKITPNYYFRDFVTHHLDRLDTGPSVKYWEENLSKIFPPPELPVAIQSSEICSPRFKRLSKTLSKDTSSLIHQFASSASVSPTSIILSLFSLVLSRWSKSQQFSLNVTMFNRPANIPKAHGVVGDFTNNILLPINVDSSSIPIQTLSQAIQEDLLSAIDHSDISGIQILRQLAAHTEIKNMPIVFTSLLGMDSSEIFSWPSNPLFSISQTPQTCLDHQVYEHDSKITLIWDYVDELFPKNMIQEMFEAYLGLFDSLKKTPVKKPIAFEIPERQKLIRNDANQTESPISQEYLHTLFLKKADIYPEKIAVKTSRKTLTYRDLKNMSSQICQAISSPPRQANELVGIALHKGWEQPIATLGTLMSGAAYLPIDPDLPQDRIDYIIKSTEVKIILTQSSVHKQFKWPKSVKLIDIDTFQFEDTFIPFPTRQTPSDLAYVIFTSGSTGTPKGVMIDHIGAVNTILDINKKFNITHTDNIIGISCLNFDLSVYDLFGTFAAGASLILPDGCQLRNPEHIADLMTKEKITIWNSVPALMEMYLSFIRGNPNLIPKNLRVAMLSGDWIPLKLPSQLKEITPSTQLYSLGGATEASIWSIFYPVNHLDKHWKSIPYGKPLTNQSFYVLNSNLENCPEWVKGELYIGGIGVAKGYWKNKEKTSSHFITHPKWKSKLYRTGDWGRYLPDGNIEFLGREDGQVKIRGHRIECGEIESKLQEIPNIKRAIVIPHKSENTLNLVAYYTTVDNKSSIKQTHLKDFLLKKVPDYMVPLVFIEVKEFPLTSNGKVNTNQLPDPNFHFYDVREIQDAPSTPLEKEIAKLWGSILNINTIGTTESFFSLGGDSLSLIKMLQKIETTTSHTMPIGIFLKNPTISAITAYIDDGKIESKNLLQQDIQQIDNVDTLLEYDYENLAKVSTVFLTGATGFLGTRILAELLAAGKFVICLIRATSKSEALEKLTSSLQKYNLISEVNFFRIQIVLGDLSRKDFGLDEKSFNELSKQTDLFIHNGAIVNFVHSYDDLRAVNVLSVKDAIKFCSNIKTIPLTFVSTIGVYESPEFSSKTIILDTTPPASPDKAYLGYHLSKIAAERLINSASAIGLPCTIVRPSIMSGGTDTLVFNKNDFIYKMIIGTILSKSGPNLDIDLNFLPVDFVAKAILTISMTQKSYGKAINIVNSNSILWPELVSWIQKDISVELLAFQEWVNYLSTLHPDNPLLPLLPNLQAKVYKDFSLLEMLTIKNKAQVKPELLLDILEIPETPKIDQSIFSKYLKYIQNKELSPEFQLS